MIFGVSSTICEVEGVEEARRGEDVDEEVLVLEVVVRVETGGKVVESVPKYETLIGSLSPIPICSGVFFGSSLTPHHLNTKHLGS